MGGSVVDAIGAIANPVGYVTGQLPATLAVSPKRADEFGRGVKKVGMKLAGVPDEQSTGEGLPPAPSVANPEVQASAQAQRVNRGRASTYLSKPGSGLLPSSGGLFKSYLGA